LERKISEDIDKSIKDKFPIVIENLISCSKPFKTNIEISTLGTKPFIYSTNTKAYSNEEIVNVMKPIIDKDRISVVQAFLQVWIDISKDKNPRAETNEKLIKLIGLIVSLDTDAIALFTGFKYAAYQIHSNKQADRSDACRLAHFIYTLACFIPVEKFESEFNFWDFFVDFCKEFEKIEEPIVVIWINEIINLLLKRLINENRDKSAYKNLYEYVQKIIKNVTKYCLDSRDDKKLDYPHPPSINEFSMGFTISSGALVSLKSTLYSTVTTLWRKETQEKLILQFQSATSQLVQALTNTQSNTELDIQLMSELLAALFSSGKSLLAKIYRKDIMEFFTSDYFFPSMNENILCLESWNQIIHCISNACYGDR
jgi:hypothetical protein